MPFQALFFLYLIWMVFIIMNLLVGLTVNKIDELIRTGEKIQASKRVEDIIGMSKTLFESPKLQNLASWFCFQLPRRIMSDKRLSKEKTKVIIIKRNWLKNNLKIL